MLQRLTVTYGDHCRWEIDTDDYKVEDTPAGLTVIAKRPAEPTPQRNGATAKPAGGFSEVVRAIAERANERAATSSSGCCGE